MWDNNTVGQVGPPDRELYTEWITGKKKLIEDDRAREFELLFQPPLFCALPEPNEVVAIYAELEVPTKPGIGLTFQIPGEYHKAILDRLRECRIDTRPIFEWSEAGSLKLYSRNGKMIRVCWYPMQAKNGPLIISIHGIRYVMLNPNDEADLGIAFTRLIERARADSK